MSYSLVLSLCTIHISWFNVLVIYTGLMYWLYVSFYVYVWGIPPGALVSSHSYQANDYEIGYGKHQAP